MNIFEKYRKVISFLFYTVGSALAFMLGGEILLNLWGLSWNVPVREGIFITRGVSLAVLMISANAQFSEKKHGKALLLLTLALLFSVLSWIVLPS